tara:strand:+ start:485 stop:883 length:399 start_codon:yes stop_codon:yes gene_type:complete
MSCVEEALNITPEAVVCVKLPDAVDDRINNFSPVDVCVKLADMSASADVVKFAVDVCVKSPDISTMPPGSLSASDVCVKLADASTVASRRPEAAVTLDEVPITVMEPKNVTELAVVLVKLAEEVPEAEAMMP